MGYSKNRTPVVREPGLFGSCRVNRNLFFIINFFTCLLCYVCAPLVQAQETAAGGPVADAGFGHNLVIGEGPGLPSYIVFRFGEKKPVAIRVLFVLDGSLLVAPLRFQEASGDFRGEFPTPQESLMYQFQASFADGSVLLSETFTADAGCAGAEAHRIIAAAKKYPQQPELLEQVRALDLDIARLKYSLSSLDYVLRGVK